LNRDVARRCDTELQMKVRAMIAEQGLRDRSIGSSTRQKDYPRPDESTARWLISWANLITIFSRPSRLIAQRRHGSVPQYDRTFRFHVRFYGSQQTARRPRTPMMCRLSPEVKAI
jgi:hypothetical protein